MLSRLSAIAISSDITYPMWEYLITLSLGGIDLDQNISVLFVRNEFRPVVEGVEGLKPAFSISFGRLIEIKVWSCVFTV